MGWRCFLRLMNFMLCFIRFKVTACKGSPMFCAIGVIPSLPPSVSHTCSLAWNVCSTIYLLFILITSPLTLILFLFSLSLFACDHWPFFSYLARSMAVTPATSTVPSHHFNLLCPLSSPPPSLSFSLSFDCCPPPPPPPPSPHPVKGRMPKRNALLSTQLSW